jgi:hypothetical protein
MQLDQQDRDVSGHAAGSIGLGLEAQVGRRRHLLLE